MKQPKTKTNEPVMLGSLKPGAKFIYDNKLWEVKKHNPVVDRCEHEGTADCRLINSAVIKSICRGNYVVPA
jgi:hypothetical protein